MKLLSMRASNMARPFLYGLFSIVLFATFLMLLANAMEGGAWLLFVSQRSSSAAQQDFLVDDMVAAPSLPLSASNTFRLAIFADLHFGEEEHGWGIDQDIKSTRVMRSVLADEKPLNLVVLNGDLITGENTFRENSSDYINEIVAPMVWAGTPWASTYGNHDSKFNLSREAIYATEKTYGPLSLTTRMNASLPGITNYYILLLGRSGPVAVLWFFDSRGGAIYQDTTAIEQDNLPNWVANDTVAWFQATAAQLSAAYGPLPSLAFVHIPPHVFLRAQERGVDPARFPGINDDVPLAYEGEGTQDALFIEALRNAKGLHSVYVGHDHGDAWCALWPNGANASPGAGGVRTARRQMKKTKGRDSGNGPFLCFSKHTGYGGYGTWNRGARIVELHFATGEMEVQTWVRMENHQVVTAVSLNATYGEDIYPTADGQ